MFWTRVNKSTLGGLVRTDTTRKIQQVEFSVHYLRTPENWWAEVCPSSTFRCKTTSKFMNCSNVSTCLAGMFREAELCEDVLWLSLVFVTRDCEPRAATWRQLSHCGSSHGWQGLDQGIPSGIPNGIPVKVLRAQAQHLQRIELLPRYSFASDVWSYGVTIYEAAMLVPPFRGANICQAGIKLAQKAWEKWTCRHVRGSMINCRSSSWLFLVPHFEISSFSWSNFDFERGWSASASEARLYLHFLHSTCFYLLFSKTQGLHSHLCIESFPLLQVSNYKFHLICPNICPILFHGIWTIIKGHTVERKHDKKVENSKPRECAVTVPVRIWELQPDTKPGMMTNDGRESRADPQKQKEIKPKSLI